MTEIHPINDIDFECGFTDGTCVFDGCNKKAAWCVMNNRVVCLEESYVCEEHLPK
jgi:hypothetical protein